MEARNVKIDELKARVARADYRIDADAVAEAFIARMRAVQGAARRADVRALLGDAADELPCSAA